MKKLFKKIIGYRDDLKLNKKWWHRLLSTLFVFSFIFSVSIWVIDYTQSNEFLRWEKTESLNDRITKEVKKPKYFLKDGEKLGQSIYGLNSYQSESEKKYLDDVYCSSELSKNVKNIKDDKNIINLFIRKLYGTEEVPLNVFEDYISNNNIKCLVSDSYSSFEKKSLQFNTITFLEPDKSLQDDWSFYEVSVLKTTINFLLALSVVLIFCSLIFSIILLIYYRVIVYIIYGKK